MEAMNHNSTLYSDLAMNLESTHSNVIPNTLFIAVLCLCLVVGHLLEAYRWLNESIAAILIVKLLSFFLILFIGFGLRFSHPDCLRVVGSSRGSCDCPPDDLFVDMGFVVGTIILCTSKWKSSRLLRFNEELFFIYLLPPIIFNAGFQVKKKQFFHNFFPIMLFGVAGVLISTSIVAAGIGTIFSSTDTVLNQDETPLLYSLVFGEGVVNDATSVVLFNAVQKINADTLNGQTALRIFLDFLYLFSTSTAGLETAFILRGLSFGRHSSVREIALMVLVAYLPYMLTELFELSGIPTVFFAGVLIYAFATLSYIAETFIFLYVGMDALDYEKWKMSTLSFWTKMGLYSTVMFLIAVGRVAFVFPLSIISNYLHRSGESSKISGHHQVFGFLTKPLVNHLLPATNSITKNRKPREPGSPKEDMTLPLLSLEESASENLSRAKENVSMLMDWPVYTIHSYWRRFDQTYMRPIFGGPCSNDPSC
ncbi:hypothetical protein L1987_55714 [Smallanthus sonchifolius]|uniref:Uncharacterized protein n=1 Tax=Smallanthus sonchifolius TaxID=185202 RepID=A0ACB9EB33_9ASTR|nr:hypothetical protein L1987_55714 [Smallanthus sonchifolius]